MEARNQLWGGARVEKQKLSHDARTIIKVIITIVAIKPVIRLIAYCLPISILPIIALIFMWTNWTGKGRKKKPEVTAAQMLEVEISELEQDLKRHISE